MSKAFSEPRLRSWGVVESEGFKLNFFASIRTMQEVE